MQLVNSPVTGLRERQKTARRDALALAAYTLTRERGLDGATIEAICEITEVSPRTFFNYFDSKEDAVIAVVPLRVEPEVAEQFAAGGPTGSDAHDLQAVAASVLRSGSRGSIRMRELIDLVHSEPRLLARHLLAMNARCEQLEALAARRRNDAETTPRDQASAATVFALVQLSVRAWEGSGQRGQPLDHLPVVAAHLRELQT